MLTNIIIFSKQSIISLSSRLAKYPVHIALGILTFLFVLEHSPAVSDTYWDLRAGQDIWHLRSVWTDHYTYTIFGHYWPNSEWLFQAILYGLYRLGGGTMVLPILINSLIAAGTFLLFIPPEELLSRFNRTLKITDIALLLPVTCIYCYIWVTIRPEVASVAMVGIILFLLRKEKYRWIPLAIFIWANFHVEFIFGIAILVMSVAMAVIINWKEPSFEHHRRIIQLVKALGVSVIVSFAQPLTYKLWVFALVSSNVSNREISEDMPIFNSPLLISIVGVLFAISIIFVLRKVRIKKGDWNLLVYAFPALFFLIMGAKINRVVPIFMGCTFPFFVMSITTRPSHRKVGWIKQKSKQLFTDPSVRAGVYTFAIIIILGVAAFRLSIGYSQTKHPIGSRDIAAFNSCRGNEFNDFWSGGYLIWFDPQRKVFLDNREDPYPQYLRNMIILNKRSNWQHVFKQYHIQCAFLSSLGYDAYQLQRAGWKKTYSDYRGNWFAFDSPAYYHSHH